MNVSCLQVTVIHFCKWSGCRALLVTFMALFLRTGSATQKSLKLKSGLKAFLKANELITAESEENQLQLEMHENSLVTCRQHAGGKGVYGRAVALKAAASKARSACSLPVYGLCRSILPISPVIQMSSSALSVLQRRNNLGEQSVNYCRSHLTFFGIFTSQYFSLFLAVFHPCQFSSYVKDCQ